MEGGFELGVPGFGVPAAFVFGLFYQADVFVGFDEFDAAFDELLVVVGPVGREFGDGNGVVTLKPSRG